MEEILEIGVIRPSYLLWGAPLLFIEKSDGSLWFLVDYYALDKLKIKESYPLL